MLKTLDTASLGPKRLTQILAGAALLALVLGGIAIFLMNAQITDIQHTLTTKESQVGSNQQIAKRYQNTLTNYNTTLARTQYLEASVSAQSFIPTLLKQLQDLATATHLTVVDVRPGEITTPTPVGTKSSDASTDAAVITKKAPPPPYDTVDISLDVTGTYVDTARFLYGLTQFPKIVSVGNTQMQPDGSTGVGSPQIKTSMHLTAFVFHDTTVQGPSDAAPASPILSGGTRTVISDAAGHAAKSAVGATQAEQARSEVGIQTL